MGQVVIFDDINPKDNNETYIGNNLYIKIDPADPDQISLKCRGDIIKKVNLKDKVSKRLFIVEAVDLGCIQSRLASALGISRQTIHNYLEIRKYFGLEGVIYNYNPAESKSLSRQREIHSKERLKGNQAIQVAEIRKNKKEEIAKKQIEIDFNFGPSGEAQEVEAGEQPFNEEHDWVSTRYAGGFCYIPTLVSQCHWLNLVMGYFGTGYKIFMVFLLMAAKNIRSIEQIKHVRSREAGALLGIKKIPSKPILWKWFYIVADQRKSQYLKKDYFGYLLRVGVLGFWLWFSDGHLLPYTGQEKVHYSYNTQRRMPFPGQTNIVTCDESGRIVDFKIYEGKGDLCCHMKSLYQEWKDEVPGCPLMVIDREIYGAPSFSTLVKEGIFFVTWDKNVDTKKLSELDDELFTVNFEVNNKQYGAFEEEKTFKYTPPDGGKDDEHSFKLRRIYLWNKTSKRRTCGLAWTGDQDVSTEECAWAVLSRWGASENTFKHIKDRHPFHYHPGFKLTKSSKQEIKNPKIKKKEGLIARIKKKLATLYKNMTKSKEILKKDGTPRKNSARERINAEIKAMEADLKQIREEKKALPEKVDPSTLEDYRSFKKIDNEGKNLFDFVTSSVWNARKDMVDWLRPYYNEENEIVDLFYAIADCHGWIKSTKKEVVVRLEPLQQPKRRAAQEKLCRKLTNLGAMTPKGKWVKIEVAEQVLR